MVVFKGRQANSIFAYFHLQVIHTKVWGTLFTKVLKNYSKKITNFTPSLLRSQPKHGQLNVQKCHQLRTDRFFRKHFFSGLKPERNLSVVTCSEDQVYSAIWPWMEGWWGHSKQLGRRTACIFRVCLPGLWCGWVPRGCNMQAAGRDILADGDLTRLSLCRDCEAKLLHTWNGSEDGLGHWGRETLDAVPEDAEKQI